MRVVVDTNVIVAGLRSRTGASRKILRMVSENELEFLLSVAMIFEYEDVLKRPHILESIFLTTEEIDGFLESLISLATPIWPDFSWRPILPDPKDEHVFETAVNGFADVIITFNVKDFKPAKKFGIEVVRPSEFLWRINNG